MKVTSIHRPEHRPLADMLRQMRVEAGLTQSEAAEALGISQTGLSDIEIGERGIDYLFVFDVCQLYGKPFDEFATAFIKAVGGRKEQVAPRVVRKDRKRPL